MAKTLTIRLDEQDRSILEEAARRQGSGLSAFLRQMAEAEAKRLRRERIKAEGERVIEYLATHPKAQDELDDVGTPSDFE